MSLVYVCDNCDTELGKETLKFEVSHQPLKHQHGIPQITGERDSKGGHFCSEKCVAEYFGGKTITRGNSGVGKLKAEVKLVNCDCDIERIAQVLADRMREKKRSKGVTS